MSEPRRRKKQPQPRDGHWCLDERLLDRFPRPLFPSGPHLCECHGRYRNPAAPLLSLAQCPAPGAQSAPFPDVVLLGRRFRRTRRPVYPLPRPYRAHRATAQLSSAKRAWLVISRLARKLASWPRTPAGLLPSTKQGLRPVPPFQFQPFVPPGPVRPFHAPHPVACSLLGLALFVFTSHTCLASSFPPPPLPARHRIPGIPLRLTTSSL